MKKLQEATRNFQIYGLGYKNIDVVVVFFLGWVGGIDTEKKHIVLEALMILKYIVLKKAHSVKNIKHIKEVLKKLLNFFPHKNTGHQKEVLKKILLKFLCEISHSNFLYHYKRTSERSPKKKEIFF